MTSALQPLGHRRVLSIGFTGLMLLLPTRWAWSFALDLQPLISKAHGETLDVIMGRMEVGLLIGHEGPLQDASPLEVFSRGEDHPT